MAKALKWRRYALFGGRREEWDTCSGASSSPPRDALGSWVLASHCDLDDPHRLVGPRACAGREHRHDALEQFRGGPAGAVCKQLANATMVDADNLLLLRPPLPFGAGARGRRALLRAAIR